MSCFFYLSTNTYSLCCLVPTEVSLFLKIVMNVFYLESNFRTWFGFCWLKANLLAPDNWYYEFYCFRYNLYSLEIKFLIMWIVILLSIIMIYSYWIIRLLSILELSQPVDWLIWVLSVYYKVLLHIWRFAASCMPLCRVS